MGTQVGAFPVALGSAWWPRELGRCLHPITLGSQLRVLGQKLSNPALVIIWSWTWGEAGFPNTAIPSATS